MSYVLSLIAPSTGRGLTSEMTDAARAVALDVGAAPGVGCWLAPGEAWEAAFQGAEPAVVEASVRERLADTAVDIAVTPVMDRRKRLLVADMDSTLITVECIDEMGAALGLRDRISAITERAMRGELDFEAALSERVALLTGLEETALERIYEERIRLMAGARTLARTMAANGAHTAIVSGGFTFFADRVRAAAGFHEARANVLDVADNRLTGRVRPPIIGRDAKVETLVALRGAGSLAPSETLAVGDGANDLAMIAEAGLGVAFRAKPVVAAAAKVRINHGDLTALLFLQGYTADEFVTD